MSLGKVLSVVPVLFLCAAVAAGEAPPRPPTLTSQIPM
jgi:hypothetical protein